MIGAFLVAYKKQYSLCSRVILITYATQIIQTHILHTVTVVNICHFHNKDIDLTLYL